MKTPFQYEKGVFPIDGIVQKGDLTLKIQGMKQGFDASQDLTQFAAGLVSAGYSFVGRYYNINNPSKNLTLAEAKALSAAGIAIIAVWENGYPTEASYFSHDVGVYDGTSAYYYAHKTIGQPSGNPIYFAVDYDASTADLASGIIPYFQGIADGFNAISSNSPVYPVGIYGSGLVCQALLGQNLATYAWLAQSSGWQDSSSFTGYNMKQLMQQLECPTINGGVEGDPDVSPNGNEGSFMIS